MFNQEIDYLPSNLKIIHFGNAFNKKIKFPDSVEEIYFGINFNQEISELPTKLKKISIFTPLRIPG